MKTYLVGGAVRDRLLGRPTDDVDVSLEGDPEEAAKTIARATGGAAFQLSGAFGAWRVVGPGHAWHVDLGDEPVERGAEAVLIGARGGERLLAEEMARRLGTINYEITCGIARRVPRRYHRDGEPA